MVLLGYRVGPLVKKTLREVLHDDLLGLAAQGAYYFFFSLFPIFLFLAPLLSLVGDKEQFFDRIIAQLGTSVPPDAFLLIRSVVAQVIFTQGAPGLISVGALLAIWAGSNVFSALIDSLNRAYEVPETRPWWKTKLLAMASVIVAGGIIAVATVIVVAGEQITGWLATRLGLSTLQQVIWTVVQFALAALLLVLLASLALYFLPNLRQSWRHVIAGGVLATVLWGIVTFCFRLYVQHFGDYNKTYGTIGGVIVLLTWMYLSILSFLIGGELASELHHGTGAVTPRHGVLYGDRIETGRSAATASTDRIERLEPLGAGGAEQHGHPARDA